MQFAICNEIYGDWEFERAAAHAAETGYDAIEIAPFTLAPDVTEVSAARRREVTKAAAGAGLAISGIHWVLSKTEGLHVSHPDASVRRKTADYYVELVRFCADIGGRYIINGSPKQRDVLPGVANEDAWRMATETFYPALRAAEDAGVVICIEPLSTVETNFINTANEAIAFARGCDSAAMKIILDVKAMCSEEKAIPAIIRDTGEWCAYFHANDRNLKGPGFGDVDFKPIAAALRDIRYDGFVSVEVFSFEEGAERIASESLRYLKQMFL